MEGADGNAPKPEDGATENYNTEDKTHLIPGRPGDGTSGSSVESPTEFIPLQMEDDKKSGRCNPGGLKVIIISAVSFSVVVTVALIITIYFGPTQVLLHQAVASDSRECSQIGTQMIEKGGSSVDAAIATTICMGVVLPTQTGLGGGGFMIIRNNAKKTTKVLDFMATAPAAVSETTYDSEPDAAKTGPRSVAVPAVLKGLKEAHETYGTLAWSIIVAPSVLLARDGFNVSKQLEEDLMNVGPDQYPSIRDAFSVDGDWVRVGDTLKQPDLANLLESISINGAGPMYEGDIATEIVNSVGESVNGYITADDLASYSVQWPNPMHVTFMGQVVESVGAPSGGPLVLSSLNILNNFIWTNESAREKLSYHKLVEAEKYAYAQRGLLGDPYNDPEVNAIIDAFMINGSYSAILASEISNGTATLPRNQYHQPLTSLTFPPGNSGSTVAVFGKEEEMVAISTTLGSKLGSGIRTSSGIILNSLMGHFTIPAATVDNTANNVGPGKRPVTPLAPTVTYSAEKPCSRRMALGGRGDLSALAAVTEVVLRLVGFRSTLDSAISSPRMVDIMDGTGLHVEPGLEPTTITFLENMNHIINQNWSTNMVNAVAKINETVTAVADGRGGGEGDIL